MTDRELKARVEKLHRRAKQIRTQPHLDKIMATFPAEMRENLLEAIRPKLKLHPTEK